MNNPARFFIADIHLTENEPVILAGFFAFIASLPNDCELYILGDLFDYWIGDDINTQLHQDVACALCQLSRRQIKKYNVVGNRDFLLGKAYAKRCDMKLLTDITCLKGEEQTIVLLHGDLLCTDDASYQKFRSKMHNKWLQRLFLSLPKFIRHKIANKLRQKSGQYNQIKDEEIMDVNQQAVIAMFEKHHADIMIHGHTHKPNTYSFTIDNQLKHRLVLGAWHKRIWYIKQEANSCHFSLHNQSFNDYVN